MVKDCIVELSIYSWQEAGIGTHWYGELTPDDSLNSIDVTHKATKSFVKKYNKELRRNYAKDYAEAMSIKVGQEVPFFLTKEDVINRAIETWREIFPNGCKLINDRTGEVLDQ